VKNEEFAIKVLKRQENAQKYAQLTIRCADCRQFFCKKFA